MLIPVVPDAHGDNVAVKVEQWSPMLQHGSLLEAISAGDKDVVGFLLDNDYHDVNECDNSSGDTPLHLAVRQLCHDYSCWTDVVINIMEAGGDVTRQNYDGNTPVHLAFLSDTVYSSQVIVSLLQLYVQTFEKNIPSGSVNDDGLGIFHIACTTCDLQVLGTLLYYGFDREVNQISMKSTFGCAGYTPLHFAVAGGQQATVQILLSRGANVYAVDANHSNPLHLALQRADEDMIGLLLPHYDFDIDMIDKFGYTNFMAACTRNDATFVTGYLRAAAINYPTEPAICMDMQVQSIESLPFAGYTPLHFAVAARSYEVANVLLQNNAHIYDCDINCSTPLHLALYFRDQRMIDILIPHYEDFEDVVDVSGTTHFMAACVSSESMAVENFLRAAESSSNPRALIDAKVNEKSVIYAGYTPLHFAVEFGNYETAKLLLDHCADVYARDADRSTPLHLALELADTKMIDLILQYDEMLEDVVDNFGLSHFMAACAGSETMIVKEYLRVAEIRPFTSPSSLVDSSTNHERYAGYLPMHFAAEFGRADTVELLLMYNSECCILTSEKLTPLMLAEEHEAVRRVLQRNCDAHKWFYDAYLFAPTYSNVTSDGSMAND